MDKLLLTPTEAAQALGISRSKLYMLIQDQSVASVRIGGSRRIPVAALDAFLDSLWSAPPPPPSSSHTPALSSGGAPAGPRSPEPPHRPAAAEIPTRRPA